MNSLSNVQLLYGVQATCNTLIIYGMEYHLFMVALEKPSVTNCHFYLGAKYTNTQTRSSYMHSTTDFSNSVWVWFSDKIRNLIR